ncbi:hypothetical protein Taro_034164, partial [Colocasia esculenta]|nr:hypothetical protein [Colocasia esculenta]
VVVVAPTEAVVAPAEAAAAPVEVVVIPDVAAAIATTATNPAVAVGLSLHKFVIVVSTQSTCMSTLADCPRSMFYEAVRIVEASGVDTVCLCVDTLRLKLKNGNFFGHVAP